MDEVGVYFKDMTRRLEHRIYTENVNYKTGGFLKSLATDGIVKGDINGHLTGPGSKLHINLPASFMIYVIEGQSPGEYQLLQLRFRSVTGGVFILPAVPSATPDLRQLKSRRVCMKLPCPSTFRRASTASSPGSYEFRQEHGQPG